MSTVDTDPENEVCGTPNVALFALRLNENFCDVPAVGLNVKSAEVLSVAFNFIK